MKTNPIGIAIIFLLVCAFAAPIMAYLLIFGTHVSGEHQRWSEFGTYLAGVYSPIVAVITLVTVGVIWMLLGVANKGHENSPANQQGPLLQPNPD